MAHDGLDDLGVNTRHGQPGSARMPHRVKIEPFSFVVFLGQKVRLFPLRTLLRIALSGFQPRGPSGHQVGPEHAGRVGHVWHGKHLGLRRFGVAVALEQIRQVALDVQAGILPILGIAP
ncbi:MAG: hypothetical protein R6U98_31605 [Pirellulaceae bacterium]